MNEYHLFLSKKIIGLILKSGTFIFLHTTVESFMS